MVEKVLRTV